MFASGCSCVEFWRPMLVATASPSSARGIPDEPACATSRNLEGTPEVLPDGFRDVTAESNPICTADSGVLIAKPLM